jgi:esterase/lipase
MSKQMTQIKFTINSDIVAAFKARCASTGASMTSVIREWISTQRAIKDLVPKIHTRPQRRKAVSEIIVLLNEIYEMEEQYRDSIPEQFAQRYEQSDHTCEQLADAISLLEEAF